MHRSAEISAIDTRLPPAPSHHLLDSPSIMKLLVKQYAFAKACEAALQPCEVPHTRGKAISTLLP